jgi:hypothetical protein
MGDVIESLGATATRGQLHVLGGYDGAQLKTHQIYNPAAGTWSPAPPMLTPRMGLAAVTGPDGLIYAIGGSGGGSLSLATVEAYDPDKEAWNPKASLQTERSFLAAVTGPDGKIYAIGGLNFLPRGGALATVEVYDPKNPTLGWTPGPPLPAPRFGLAAAVGPDGLIYAIGGNGIDKGQEVAEKTVYSYDPLAPGGWIPQENLKTAQGNLAAATGPDGRIYAIGGAHIQGTEVTPLDTVEAFTVATPMTAPDPYIGGSSDVILLDSNGTPVPITPADVSWQPSKQYGISAIVYNDSTVAAPNTAVGFWLFVNVDQAQGRPTVATLIDKVNVTVPANGFMIANSPTGVSYRGLQGASVAVSIANPESPYFNVDPTTATEVLGPDVERPPGSGHCGAAWRGYPDSCLDIEAQLQNINRGDFNTAQEYEAAVRGLRVELTKCLDQWGGPFGVPDAFV